MKRRSLLKFGSMSGALALAGQLPITKAQAADTGPIKVGIHDRDFGPGRFFQADDYSYLETTHLTLYENDALVSGTPPSTPPAN